MARFKRTWKLAQDHVMNVPFLRNCGFYLPRGKVALAWIDVFIAGWFNKEHPYRDEPVKKLS